MRQLAVPSRRDAVTRAVRTFAQGLVVDVASAVTAVAATQLGDVHWTKGYWYALGVLLGKTAVMTAAAYVHARIRPPATG